MSTLSVTTVTTGLSTTDLTLNTANTGAGDIVIQSDGLGMVLSGNSSTNTLDLAPNGHIAISNNSVNTFVLTQAGTLNISNTVNSTAFTVGSTFTANATLVNSVAATITSNTLTLGTSSAAASPGWTYLPNGLKMVWGTVIANNISSATFASAFPNACLSISVTPITSAVYIGANTIYVSALSASAAFIRSASLTTTATAYYIAIGY